MTKIEVCASSLSSLINAEKYGADRIELCSELGVGGVTPSIGFIEEALINSNIPIRVLIRPRSGHFFYSKDEIKVIKRDIRLMKSFGVEGIVIGLTDQFGNLPYNEISEIVHLADSMSLTFHRAFDVLINPTNELEKLIELGFDTVLTSGQKENAYDGICFLKEINNISSDRICIMPGGGVNAENCREISNIGFKWMHLSAKKNMYRSEKNKNKSLSFQSQPFFEFDPKILKIVKQKIS